MRIRFTANGAISIQTVDFLGNGLRGDTTNAYKYVHIDTHNYTGIVDTRYVDIRVYYTARQCAVWNLYAYLTQQWYMYRIHECIGVCRFRLLLLAPSPLDCAIYYT